MNVTLRQLEYVVAIAEKGSFSRAAESCHVTQPALSLQVQQLETQVGVKLFERAARHVLLTPAGEEVVRRARRVFAEMDGLLGATRAFQEPLTGDLRLGAIPTVAPYLLPRALPCITAEHPALRLLLSERQTDRLVEQLQAGVLDVALLALEADLSDLARVPLFRDPFLLAVPEASLLASRETVREDDLLALKGALLLLEDGHCLRDQVLAVCDGAGASELGDFRASSLGTLVQMVAGGVGATLLPRLAADDVRGAPIRLLPFEEPAPFRTIGLCWRASSPRAAEFELLIPLFERSAS